MTQPPPPFLLRTLGGLVLERRAPDGTSTVVLRGGKPLALLAYLCVADGKRLRREALADVLWGDESPESARGSLRQALHTLRRAVGEELFDGNRAELVLRAGAVEADHTRFMDVSTTGDVEAMLRWYRGPFCAELVVRGALALERWIDAERTRLRRLMLLAAQHQVTECTASGALERAAQVARALYAAEPSMEEVVLLTADALVATGAFADARGVLETFRARQFADVESLSDGVATRLAKLKAAAPARRAPEEGWGSIVELGQRFVGREEIFAELFRARDAAREGRLVRLVLVGPPGIGKTRVLDEFEARMRSRGARVVRVRFLPAMRAIGGSAFAEYARALCALPGAMGISEISAATLTAMLPELRDRFPAAVRRDVAPEDLARARAEAVADLLAAVAEERLVIVLVDDDHNMDPASRAMLEGALRHPDLRLLEVRSTRSADAAITAHTGAGVTRLPMRPFTVRNLRDLLEASGRLPDGEWVDLALQVLIDETGGIPQLLLLRLRTLGASGALRLDGDTWRIDSAAELVERLPSAPFVGDLVTSLPAVARHALQVLSHFRRAMPESALFGVLAMVDPGYGLNEWQGALALLESRGLALARDDGWTVAHDTVAEATLATQLPHEGEGVQLAIVQHYSGLDHLSVPVLEHLALLCGTTGSQSAALLLVRAASSNRGLRAVGLRGRTLAARVANAAGREDWESDLVRATGWIEQRSGRALLAIGSGVGLASVALIWLVFMLWPRLVIDSVPMADFINRSGSTLFAIQPRVLVVDGFGRRLTKYSGAIRVRGLQRQVIGDTVVFPTDGTVQFERLLALELPSGVNDTTQLMLEFSSARFARSVRVLVAGAWGNVQDDFRPIRVVVNGVELDSTLRVIAPLGDSLRLALTFEYTTTRPTSNYIVGAAATWLPREVSTVRLAGLPRPVRRAWQTSQFTLPPPPRPGLYHIIVLMNDNDSVDHIFSLTEWTLGLPRWYDGHDVVDMSPAQLGVLREKGRVELNTLVFPYQRPQSDGVVGNQRQARETGVAPYLRNLVYFGTAIEVEVKTP